MAKQFDEEIRRHSKENPYTLILNSMLQSDGLTFHQKGMMAELWSKSDDWIIYKSWLMKRSELGRDAFNRQWKDLQAKGYLVKEIVRDAQGRFSKVIWHLYQTPVEVVAPEVKEVAQEDQKVKETETKVSQEIKEIAEQELEAVFTTLDAMEHLEEEEKETIREEIVDEFGQTLDKTWVQENFREAWEETLDNLKCREYFVSYLINHMKNNLSFKRLKEAQASKEIASPTLDFYIPMDGPWNGHD